MPRNSYRTNFVQEMCGHASDVPFPGNIKFAIGYGIRWQNRSTRFVHQCICGTSVMWPSHARDWSRQHNSPMNGQLHLCQICLPKQLCCCFHHTNKPEVQIKKTTGCLDRGKVGISTYNAGFGTGPKPQHDLAAIPQFIVLIIFQY
jgi:hypothetical protein